MSFIDGIYAGAGAGSGSGLRRDWASGGWDLADVGPVDPATPVSAADPQKEYVVQEPNGMTPFGEWPDRFLDGPCAWHSAREYERMHLIPAVGSSFNTLRASVLSGGVGLLPAIKPRFAAAKPGQSDGTAVEADMAADIWESNARLLNAWESPADVVLWEMMESMYLGHTLAERVMDDVVGGPDDGLLAIRALKPKPRSSYRFLTDRAGNVVRINGLTADGWQQFEPEKFAWLTWDPHRGDPRGRSCYRMAHHAAQMLVRLWPEIEKGWCQFGTPWTFLTTAPNPPSKMVPVRDARGEPIPGRNMTNEQALALAGMGLRNGKVVAAANGADAKVIESTKDSSVVSGAISILEAQIKASILLAIRATTEAQHGSKADSGTAQDVMGTMVRFIRKWLERFLRRVLMGQNALNYGDDLARRLTPLVTLGDHEHQDFAANSAGVGVLYQASYFTQGQLPYVDTFLGLPQRQAGDLRVGPNGLVPDTLPVDPAAAVDPAAPADPNAPAPAAAPAQGVAS